MEALGIALRRKVAQKLDNAIDLVRPRRSQPNRAAIAENYIGMAREQFSRVRALVLLILRRELRFGRGGRRRIRAL